MVSQNFAGIEGDILIFRLPGGDSKEKMDLFEPTLFIYDNYPGGMGFSHQLFDDTKTLLEKTMRLISRCECRSGCPSCVGPVKEVGEKSKEVAVVLLREILK